MSRILKLGTRKSLLALAQSSWVAREIERRNPGIRVELVGIETRGDRILDVSLQAIAQTTGGKEFFVAEIDQALRSGAADLTVHSMKDLSLDRPADFVCAAIPRRENPRDVVVFGPGVLEKLRQGGCLRIGTSSPRRLENIPPFLAGALPRLPGAPRDPRVELVEIRGNVNTRLGRVREPRGSERRLDGVVLAFAGLIRLWNDEKGREELKQLLAGARWMVLPLRECPAAPAQGALAIECRRSDEEVFGFLRKIHDADTEAHVARERQLLADWGGGCHQKFGATAVSTANLSRLFFIRGKKPDGGFVEELRWQAPASPGAPASVWDGSQWRAEAVTETLPLSSPELGDAPAYFVSHWRALAGAAGRLNEKARIWVSGTSSWRKLAEQGYWVEGCAENLGFGAIGGTLREEVLQLPELPRWNVLTHAGAADGWQCPVIETYRLASGGYSEEALRALERATHVFWSSGSQFDELKGRVSRNAHQACGPGKTSEHILQAGVSVDVFPSAEEWRKWIRK